MAGRPGASSVPDAETTAVRRRAAGFTDVGTGLKSARTVPAGADEFGEFLTAVNMRPRLPRLPEGSLRRRFVDEPTEQAAHDDPYRYRRC